MNSEKLRATPAARKLAEKLNLDLALITGTGAAGRVHKDDVIEFSATNVLRISPLAKKMAEVNNINLEGVVGSGIHGKIMKEDILKLMKPEVVETKVSEVKEEKVVETNESNKSNEYGNIELIPMSAMRKVIAKRMLDSYLTAPTFTLNYDIDMSEMIALRKKLIDPIMTATGKKVTITDLIALAVVKTLKNHKYLNSSLTADGKFIELHDYVNLAIAVGFDEGLLTPVIFNADKLSISELVVKSKEVTTKALNMKLAPNELQGSTFTISNLGMYGVQSFGPIINQPNSAILGVSATIEKPVVINKEIVIRPIMSLGLTIDHRVVDGLAGAKFMKELKELIENPISMLI